jgi:predicted glycosyltransferase
MDYFEYLLRARISDSLGLGHIVRDIEIANELRRYIPEVQIDWIATPPASNLLLEKKKDFY